MRHKTRAVVYTAMVFTAALLACTMESAIKPPALEVTAVPGFSLPTPTGMPAPSPLPMPTSPGEVPAVGSSSGGMVEKLSLEDLTLRAGRILVGTVVDLKSEWNNERTLIYTYVTIAVEDHIKGVPDQKEVTVMVPGGQVGNVGVSTSGVPEFSEGEKVLLFLEGDEAGIFHVLGGFQGKLVIYGDKVFVEGKEMPLTDLVNEIQGILEGR